MNKYITNFKDSGNCDIDVNKIVKDWKSHWIISRWNDDYTFIIPDMRSKERCIIKINISRKDALAIINKVCLVDIPSVIFKNANTYKNIKT